MSLDLQYPADSSSRAEWIVAQRPRRNQLAPDRPYAFFVEDEYSAAGEIVPVATIFLTNRECPWRCVMCDLWKNTGTAPTEPGSIPHQIEYALERLPAAREIKLYNSGSFFDAQAIPPQDYRAIANLVQAFERVIVECHPSLVGSRTFAFQDLLEHPLEVAMGLETAHPEVLEKLNKGMTLDQYATAARTLRAHGADLRVFLLVQPPFMRPEETLSWTRRSLDFAFKCGATAASLIPTRGGNGAMETLAQINVFSPPSLKVLEDNMEYGLSLKHGRVFADLWDLSRNAPRCASCWPARIERLRKMNLTQSAQEPVACMQCEGLS
ncbi:MAG TPA: radical SAM protein [Terracidiphilus sp.]|nr:radical SAM protein [Terracidiphilus sp.]